MIRNLPNRATVRYSHNTESARPFVVDMRTDVREHVSFGPRVLQSKITFISHVVGRYRSERAAEAAAVRSVKRHGGVAHGMRGPLTRIIGCEPENGGSP